MSPADGSQDITQQTTTKKAPATESYLTVVAGAGDVGVIFGKALADVTAGNAPVLATVGSLTANVYNNAAGVAFYIPAKTSVRFKLDRGQDNFMGLIGAGGIVYFYQSSPTTDGV